MIEILIDKCWRESFDLSSACPAFLSHASFLGTTIRCHGNQNNAKDETNYADDDANGDKNSSPFLITIVLRSTVLTANYLVAFLTVMSVLWTVQLITTALPQAGSFVSAASSGHIRAAVK